MIRETLLIALLATPVSSAATNAQLSPAIVTPESSRQSIEVERASRSGSRADCVATTQENLPPLFSDSLGIVFGRDVPRKLVEQAVEQWKGCAGYGMDFPRLLIGKPGTQTIEVKLDRAYRGSSRCGEFQGRKITLYSFAIGALGRTHYCGSRADGLAHELGHALGLLDAPMETGCRDHAMAVIDASYRDRRQIQPEECLSVGRRWLTPYEIPQEAGSDTVRLASRWTNGF